MILAALVISVMLGILVVVITGAVFNSGGEMDTLKFAWLCSSIACFVGYLLAEAL